MVVGGGWRGRPSSARGIPHSEAAQKGGACEAQRREQGVGAGVRPRGGGPPSARESEIFLVVEIACATSAASTFGVRSCVRSERHAHARLLACPSDWDPGCREE